MDELFDIFDAVSDLGNLTDLTDHADTLLTALDALDYIDIDVSDLSMLDDLASFGPEDMTSIVDSFDPADMFIDTNLDSDTFTDSSWLSFDDVANPGEIDFGDVESFVNYELSGYPDHLCSRLDGVIYHPEPSPDTLGFWEPHGASAHIELYDHQESIGLTLHHEMAHHLMAKHSDLFEEIAPHMTASPILNHLGIDLSDYTPEQRPEEFVAETFAFFKTKPELFQQFDPALYAKFANWWHTHIKFA
ncbi:MAG TPA: hypothetical protein VIT91_06925 [Chthoniobacterales bacterium]